MKPRPHLEARIAALKGKGPVTVQTVYAPQLFPTPKALAARMVELAAVEPGEEVLEPEAGTGVIADAIIAAGGRPYCIELNHTLCEALARRYGVGGVCTNVLQADFLECGRDMLGTFSTILMNPPFKNAEDIKHIRHALTLLKPNGHLVAICAAGPRQREAFEDIAEHFEELPAGTFADTNVRSFLIVLRG